MSLIENFLSHVHSQCPLCKEKAKGGYFCESCQHNISDAMRNHPKQCPICQLPLLPDQACPDCYQHCLSLSYITALFYYVPPLDSLVLRFKNAKQIHLSRAFADLLYKQLCYLNRLPKPNTLLIPIPSGNRSLQKRGFNPATLLAKDIAPKLHARIDSAILRRLPSETAQKSLSRHDRFAHSAHLYYCAYRLNETEVILIDDIMTTGSTLESATRALKAAGAETVSAIVIARTV